VCVVFLKVAFKFALDPNDELHDSKLSLWIRDGHAQKIVRLCVSDNENTALAFACLRVMVQKAASSSSSFSSPLFCPSPFPSIYSYSSNYLSAEAKPLEVL
jgi:hypothetical protein